MNLFLRTATPLLFSLAFSYVPHADAFLWIPKEQATGTHDDYNANEGKAVAMLGDLLVVGATNLDRPAGDVGVPPSVADAGGVQVYHRRTGGWTLDQTLFSPNAAMGARFGASVAIAGDVLVVGEPDYTPPNISNAVRNGHALIYVRSPATGRFVFRKEIFRLGFTHDANARMPEYGTSVDVVSGGGHEYAIAVGAPGEDGVDNGSGGSSIMPDIGAALTVRIHTTDGYIEEDDLLDNSWYLLNRTLEGGVAGSHVTAFGRESFFGESVALARAACLGANCENHYWLGVGAPNSNIETGDGSVNQQTDQHGTAQLFVIDSGGATSPSDVHPQNQYLYFDASHSLYLPFFIGSLGTTGQSNQHIGAAIDLRIADDDAEMIVGAPQAPSANGAVRSGAAYYYRRHSGDCCLRGVQTLYPPNASSLVKFGASVAFAADRLLVGSPDYDLQSAFGGAAFVYEKASADAWNVPFPLWLQDATLDGAVAGSADWIAVGAPTNHGRTQAWQRGWNLHVASPDHGVVQLVPPIYPVSPAIVCPPDCDPPFENGRVLHPTAIPDDAYTFIDWTAPGTTCDNDTSATCTLVVDSDRTLAATFAFDVGNTRHLLLELAGGNGTITVTAPDNSEQSCPEECNLIYPNGTPLSLLAQPAPGFEFAEWTGACAANGGNTCSLVLNTTAQTTAVFRPIDGNHIVRVLFAGAGPGLVTLASAGAPLTCDADTASCSISQPEGSQVGVFACTTSGGTFTGWGGDCSGTDACLFDLDSDKEITATFEPSDSLFKNGFEYVVCPEGWFRPLD